MRAQPQLAAMTTSVDDGPDGVGSPVHGVREGEDHEKTRIGVPAYEASAKMVTDAIPPDEPPQADASLRTAQAVRVVVWRGPDGVYVAPYGTRVSAIAIDAMLVALDPSADLAAWLTRK